MLEGTKLVLREVSNQEENPCKHCRASLRNKYVRLSFFHFTHWNMKQLFKVFFPKISLDIKFFLQYKF
jgi:hypothetical protein